MEMIGKALLAMIWLVIVPVGIGNVFTAKKEAFCLSECYIKGYLFMFALAEIMILSLICIEAPLHVLTWSYGAILLVMLTVGSILFFKKKRSYLFTQWKEQKKVLLVFLPAVILILIQVGMVARFAHMDADDSMYVGAATTAVYTDTIYSISPYTGMPYESLPSRYVLSPFPVFLAVVSQLSAGIHPAIMAHTFLPAAFMLLVYAVMYLLAKKWFAEDLKAQGIFLMLAAVLNWFSAYSVYNAGNFQMVRLWQGKALLAAALLPLIYCVCSSLLLEKDNGQEHWRTLFMLNISCCLVSSMGIMLSVIAVFCMAAVSLCRRKNWKNCLLAALCCTPSLILGVIYIWIK